jgi:hypothetical protein
MRISFISFVVLDRFRSFCYPIVSVAVSLVSVAVPLVCRSYLCSIVPFLLVSELYKYPNSCTVVR